jgi:hypothetical protein
LIITVSLSGPPKSVHAEDFGLQDRRELPIVTAQTPGAQASEPLPGGDDSARALERILVTRGGLVLPKYTLQIEPQLLYSHTGSSRDASQRDIVVSALTFRLGVPFDAQAELRLPYVVHDETATARISGLGDVQLSLTKELLREAGRLPSLLVTARWTAPTGEGQVSPGELATGTGFHVVEGQVTAVKTHDPLAFFTTFSYSAPVARRNSHVTIEPGDLAAIKAGGILAASPDTSLGLALTLAFAAAPTARGVRTSDQTIGILEFSVGQILSRRLFLDVSVNVGVTRDAPDLGVAISLPIRF